MSATSENAKIIALEMEFARMEVVSAVLILRGKIVGK